MAKTKSPKFKVGDTVTLGNRKGQVCEVADHDDDYWKTGQEQLYSVRCPVAPMPRQDHTHDTFGCVKESEIG